MKTRRQKQKLLIGGLLIALVLIIAAGSSLAVHIQRYSKTEIYKTELRELTEQKAEQINQFLESRAAELNILMSIDEFAEALKDPADAAKLAQAKDKINELKDIIPGIRLLTNEGTVIVADINLTGTDYSAHPYFSVEERTVSFERYYDPLRKQDYYAAFSPFYDQQADETIIGVIAIDVPLEKLNGILVTDDKDMSRELYLVNKDGVIITDSIFGYTPFAQDADAGIVAACFACMQEDQEAGDIVEHEAAVSEYVDYRGAVVLGTHACAPVINACLIGEINKAEVISLSDGNSIFNSIYHAVQGNRDVLLIIYLFLAIVLIWWTSARIIVNKKVLASLPFLLIGMAICTHAAYVYLSTRQDMSVLEVSQLSVFLLNTILLVVAAGLIIIFSFFKTREGLSRRLVAIVSIFFALAFAYEAFEFYFHIHGSSGSVIKWGHAFMNIAIICYFWWIIYLFGKQLHRFSKFALLVFTVLGALIIAPEFCLDNYLVEWLHTIAIAGAAISAYLLAMYRLEYIYHKDRVPDETS
jgi:hypothetical protein